MTMQEEILTMVAWGYRNKDIAKILNLSKVCVKNKVRWLQVTHGAMDKLELAMMRWGRL